MVQIVKFYLIFPASLHFTSVSQKYKKMTGSLFMMMTTFKKVHLWLLDSNSLTLITFSLILHPMISLQSQKNNWYIHREV